MLDARDIQDEMRIVWLESTDPLDYVRQSLVPCTRRKGRIRWTVGRVVGYIEIGPEAVRDGRSDFFWRRIFWLKGYDRDSGDPTYRRGAPAEAVDPRTVSPRAPGVVTARAWGGEVES
jgi:hypothetical protein